MSAVRHIHNELNLQNRMKDILNFLTELRLNNNREWFAENKERYLMVKEKTERLTEQLLMLLSTINPEAASLSVADCTYRIYRDTRFSADKTPYKTHIGIFINPPHGKKSMTLGHYLHIEPGRCFYCAGTIGLPSPVMKAVRQSIYDEIEEYREIVENEEFKTLLPILGEDYLKTAPKGFPKDWEYIDYIRPKEFVACSKNFDKRFMTSPRLAEKLLPYMRQGEKFNRFINFTVEDFDHE